MLRLAIFGVVGLLAAGGLLLFDDVGVGLPVVNLAIWAMLIVTGGLLALRASRRRGRQERRARRSRRAQPLTRDAARLPQTPPARLTREQPRLPELPRP